MTSSVIADPQKVEERGEHGSREEVSTQTQELVETDATLAGPGMGHGNVAEWNHGNMVVWNEDGPQTLGYRHQRTRTPDTDREDHPCTHLPAEGRR